MCRYKAILCDPSRWLSPGVKKMATMLLLFLAMHEILEFQAFLYTKRLCAFQVDEVGDDICRYDARFRWYLQCFWILF
jgi:hypothetical protein